MKQDERYGTELQARANQAVVCVMLQFDFRSVLGSGSRKIK